MWQLEFLFLSWISLRFLPHRIDIFCWMHGLQLLSGALTCAANIHAALKRKLALLEKALPNTVVADSNNDPISNEIICELSIITRLHEGMQRSDVCFSRLTGFLISFIEAVPLICLICFPDSEGLQFLQNNVYVHLVCFAFEQQPIINFQCIWTDSS